jgi:hypothetical protein
MSMTMQLTEFWHALRLEALYTGFATDLTWRAPCRAVWLCTAAGSAAALPAR